MLLSFKLHDVGTKVYSVGNSSSDKGRVDFQNAAMPLSKEIQTKEG